MMSCVAITPQDAADVIGVGYKTFLKMLKNDSPEFKDIAFQVGNARYMIMRVKLITYVTGESYEEQLKHKRKLINEKNAAANTDSMKRVNDIMKRI